MNIGNNIKKYRKEKGLTQLELAEKVGLSRNALSNYEINKREPKLIQLKKIALILDIPLTKLIDGCDNISVEYLFQKDLLDLRIDGLKYYLTDTMLKDSEKTVLKNFTNDFLLDYTEMLKEISSLERKWNNLYKEYNKNSSLTESDLKILYLRENLNIHLKKLSDKVNSFPSYIVYNEINPISDSSLSTKDSE